MTNTTQPEALVADARRLANVADQVRALEAVGSDSDVYLTEAADVLRACADRIAALVAAPAQAVAAYSRGEWIAQAAQVYLDNGDDLKTANDLARWHWYQQDWISGEFDDPREVAREDLAGRDKPAAAQEHATQLAGQGQEPPPDWLPFSARTKLAERWGVRVTPAFNAQVRDVIETYIATHSAAPAQAQEDAHNAVLQALSDFHYAMDTRQHGGVAAAKALAAIEAALGVYWVEGQELAARAAQGSGNHG